MINHKRFVFDEIVQYLDTSDIIVLHGARQVGKTYILYYLKDYLVSKGEDVHYIDLEDFRMVRILDSGVEEFLKYLQEIGFSLDAYSDKKRLFIFIDEIQYLINPTSFLKLIVDHHPYLKLIVSGSSTFNIKTKFRDSLVGRTVNFTIFNLSFKEFLIFKGYSFAARENYTEKKLQELFSLYKEFILCGGYPKITLAHSIRQKEEYLKQIIDTYVRKDIRDIGNIRDIHKFNRVLEILASQSGKLLNMHELSNTTEIARNTLENYLFLLEQTYIINLVRPFSVNIRSELSKTPKIFFYDTGLMQMFWLKELPREILGQVFETNIFAELIKKYGIQNVHYWRTIDKKEIDFIIKDKQILLPLEVKLNFSQVQMTALHYFSKKYNLPEFKIVGLYGMKNNKAFIYPWDL